MGGKPGRIAADVVRARLKAGDELAFLDVREENQFSHAQPLFAVNLSLSRLERDVERLVPRRTVPVVLFDDGEGLAARAAGLLAALGYHQLAVVEGGLDGWRDAGGELFRDVNVPSKAFGEWVEGHRQTPMIDAAELRDLQHRRADVVVLDSRPFHEYRRMTVPGAVNCPGAELVLRAGGQVRSPETLVVVSCAGRTRSIIGAQSLINAGLPNPVRALRNGTIGWHLAGLPLELGADRRAEAPSGATLAWARQAAEAVASRAGVQVITDTTLATFQREAETRALFLFDVRSPEEHAAGHASGFFNAPGGQLIQATDDYVGIQGARLVLADDDGVRAPMTASWLRQMGWRDVYVLAGSLADFADGTGVWQPSAGEPAPFVPEFSAQALSVLLEENRAVVADLAPSPAHAAGHIPGARFLLRSRIETDLAQLDGDSRILVLTSPDGRLASHVWREASALAGQRPVTVLRGGTDAWRRAELPLVTGITAPLSPVDDVYKLPYEGTDNADAFMLAYIDWELRLVEQIRRDGTARFAPI